MGVTGSIAAYKACDIISALRKSGVDVHVILTHAGAEIITPLTLETISGNRVVKDMFDSDRHFEVEHISLAKLADLFLVAYREFHWQDGVRHSGRHADYYGDGYHRSRDDSPRHEYQYVP